MKKEARSAGRAVKRPKLAEAANRRKAHSTAAAVNTWNWKWKDETEDEFCLPVITDDYSSSRSDVHTQSKQFNQHLQLQRLSITQKWATERQQCYCLTLQKALVTIELHAALVGLWYAHIALTVESRWQKTLWRNWPLGWEVVARPCRTRVGLDDSLLSLLAVKCNSYLVCLSLCQVRRKQWRSCLPRIAHVMLGYCSGWDVFRYNIIEHRQ